MNKILKTAGLAFVVLATIGAGGKCGASVDDKGRTTGTDRGTACSFVPHVPYALERKIIVGQVDMQCTRPVIDATLTITLEKKGPNGWTEVAREQFLKAPALNVLKERKVTAPCEHGAYRTRYYATTQAVSEPDGMADKNGAFTDPRIVDKENC